MKTAIFTLAGIAIATLLIAADSPSSEARSFTATSDNVTNAKDPIKIDLRRLSTAEERDQVISAWTKAAAPPPAAPAPAAAPAGRGGGRGRGGPPAPRLTPEEALTAALGDTPSLGTLWSSESTGYAIHYATRTADPDGTEHFTLLTDRRLGSSNNLWKPVGASAANASTYDFSLIELRVNAKGEGEGKASITGKVVVDGAAKTIALENSAAAPVVLRNVKRAN